MRSGYGSRNYSTHESFTPYKGLCNWREQFRFIESQAKKHLRAAQREAEKQTRNSVNLVKFTNGSGKAQHIVAQHWFTFIEAKAYDHYQRQGFIRFTSEAHKRALRKIKKEWRETHDKWDAHWYHMERLRAAT